MYFNYFKMIYLIFLFKIYFNNVKRKKKKETCNSKILKKIKNTFIILGMYGIYDIHFDGFFAMIYRLYKP